ncbi:MAG: hypothetical protein B6247_20320 [Candidatus Parabeggiatoa sp. nov. 2]|nr:MAG: hypothetical protein B6247_20320 [Beggiatoa sp. 4572_84]
MKTPYLNFREGPPKRVLAYTVATVLLLMSSLPISAAQPQAKFTVTPSSGTVPLEVKLDASQSSPADNLTYHWFFAEILKKITSLGTKTSTSPKTEIIFANPGTHDIILIVLDKNGRMDVARQTFVGIDPSDEKGSETSPTGGDGSTGDGGTSDNPPTGGDGPTGDGETSDNGPTGDGEEQPTPAPANKPPLANFTYTVTPEQGPGPFTVSLDGSSSSDEDGTIVKYEWHSDGKTKSGESVDFVFQKADTYQVKLTVTDDKGATSPMTQVVIIKEPPPPPQFDYNTTARVYPQVIAAGVTPSKVDLEDTQFEIVALVRPGATAIKRVTLQDTTGKVLAPEMTLAGVLPNGDELYKVTYVGAIQHYCQGQPKPPVSYLPLPEDR